MLAVLCAYVLELAPAGSRVKVGLTFDAFAGQPPHLMSWELQVEPNDTLQKSVDDALAPGAPAIWPDNPGNEFRDPMPSALMFVSATATSGTATYLTTIDTVGWDVIEDARKKNGLPTLARVKREPAYIATAAELGRDLHALVTYDDRMAAAGRALGYPIVQPR